MKVVCLSDTHGLHEQLKVPNGQVVVHTGDFTNNGNVAETDEFLLWYSELPHPHKLLVAGNHDFFPYIHYDSFQQKCVHLGITYLQDSETTINGVKFYGTPWTPKFFDWAFMKEDYYLKPIFDKIPDDTQVLLTHGPAYGILDKVPRANVGSHTLRTKVDTLPALTHHVFGHIHESRGRKRLQQYIALNAACVDTNSDIAVPKSIYIKEPDDT